MRKETTADLAPRPEGASKSRETLLTPTVAARKTLGPFERYLSVWVGACMVVGVLLGKLLPGAHRRTPAAGVRRGQPDQHPDRRPHLADDHPMMMKVDFAAIRTSAGGRGGSSSPSSSTGWSSRSPWRSSPGSSSATSSRPGSPAAEADQYIAGAIILAAAPCTAMVFVWSYLTDGDPGYTLVQVSRQRSHHARSLRADRAVPGQRRLVTRGAVPCPLYSVGIFIVIPLVLGAASEAGSSGGAAWRGSRHTACPASRRSAWSRCSPRWC